MLKQISHNVFIMSVLFLNLVQDILKKLRKKVYGWDKSGSSGLSYFKVYVNRNWNY